MTLFRPTQSRLQKTAALQIERLTRRASYSELTGDMQAAKRHHLEAVAWQALMGRRATPPSRRAG